MTRSVISVLTTSCLFISKYVGYRLSNILTLGTTSQGTGRKKEDVKMRRKECERQSGFFFNELSANFSKKSKRLFNISNNLSVNTS